MIRKLCFVQLKHSLYRGLPYVAATNWSAMFTQLGSEAYELTGVRNRSHLYNLWKDTSQPLETDVAIFYPPTHTNGRGVYLRQ